MISEKQNELDLVKWLDSEQKGEDLCGKYEFCPLCDRWKENPCENAYLKSIEQKVKSATKPRNRKKKA